MSNNVDANGKSGLWCSSWIDGLSGKDCIKTIDFYLDM